MQEEVASKEKEDDYTKVIDEHLAKLKEPESVEPRLPNEEAYSNEEEDDYTRAIEEHLNELKSPSKKTISDTRSMSKPKAAGSFDVNKVEEVSFEQLATDEEYMGYLRAYGEDNKGNMGKQKEDESNEDYLRRFLNHTREFEWNTIDLGQQIDYLRNADAAQRDQFGYVYSQVEKLPDFYEDGGDGTVKALMRFGSAVATDPLSYLGFGTGFVARKLATRAVIEAFKQGGKKKGLKKGAIQAAKLKAARDEAAKYGFSKSLKTNPGRIAVGGLTAEAGIGAIHDLGQQEIGILTAPEDEAEEARAEGYNYGSAVFAAGLGLTFGAAGYRASGGLGMNKVFTNATQYMDKRKKILEGLKARDGSAKKRTKEATDGVVNGIFDLNDGRKALDSLGPQDKSGMTKVQFNKELMRRVGTVVTDTVSELAANGKLAGMVNEDTKAMEVIGDVVLKRLAAVEGSKSAKKVAKATADMFRGTKKETSILDSLNVEDAYFDDALESAISRAGLTPKQFVNAMGEGYSSAGTFLGTASQVGKIMKRLGRLDKDAEDILKMHSSAEKVATPMNSALDFFRRLDRERRALMVTQIATTVRNVATGVVRLTMETASDAIDSTIYQFGRGTEAALTGNQALGKGNVKDIFRDAFGRLNRLARVTDTTSLSDDLLRHNRRLAGKMDRTLQEVSDDETLSAFTRTMNLLNVAQDQFFRRGVFVNSVDKKLRRAGIVVDNPTKVGQFKSLDEFVVAGKQLPASVLSDSIDEALTFTFSKMPEGNTLAAKFVKFTEAVGPVPLGPLPNTAMFPFARFMVNAMKFQYDYSPASALSFLSRKHTARSYTKMAAAAKKGEKAGLNQQAAAQHAKAREALSKSIVGTAAFGAAIKYRADNQDVQFYEFRTDDGSTGDLRPYFPLVPYLAIADLFVKSANNEMGKANIKKTLEAFTGVQSRTGVSSYVIDNFGEAFITPLQNDGSDSPNTERVGELLGGYVAELSGGFLTPARMVRDIQAAFDTEAAVLRDPNQASGRGMDDRFYSSLKNGVYKNLPELAKQLPAMESPTRGGDVYRESSLAGQFGAPRREAPRNPAEEEMARLGIERYTVGSRTGDKAADAFVNKHMGELVEKRMATLVESDRYKSLTDTQKRVTFDRRMSVMRSYAVELGEVDARAEEKATGSGRKYTPFDRAKYGRLSNKQTRLVDDYYKEKHGKSVLEMVDEEPDVNHYLIASVVGRKLEQMY
tara:strand:- start:43 stop:3717 length:3675 start_codon:yes stop_codon:yes gene_type:complete